MKVRLKMHLEIFDAMGESIQLTGASLNQTTGDNPLFLASTFDELAARIAGDIRAAIVLKHGERP